MGSVMSATLRKQAAALELAALLESKQDTTTVLSLLPAPEMQKWLTSREILLAQATSRLIQLLDDQDYEVRALAVKFAIKTLNSDDSLLYANWTFQ